MKNLLRIILALLLTPAHLLADENVNIKDENDTETIEEEAKENDEAELEEEEEEVEEKVESADENELVAFPLTASEIANALAWFFGYAAVESSSERCSSNSGTNTIPNTGSHTGTNS